MTKEYYRVAAEINLDAVAYNMRQIRKAVRPESRIMAVVKADAYGHGAAEVSTTLLENGADYFAVAILDEAINLRNHGIDTPTLILGYSSADQAGAIVHHNITQTVFTYEMSEAISNAAVQQNKQANIHIKIDTGMGRIGLFPDSHAVECIKRMSLLPNIKIEGMFTHLACADESDKSTTYGQLNTFLSFNEMLMQQGIHIPLKHAANSACIIDVEEGHLDMVRPGLILYGLYPSDAVKKQKLPLKPVMSLKTHVVHLKEMEAGMPISYGQTYRTSKKSTIATIPVGYADGYFRALSSKGRVIINGQYAPIVGRICMDQFMVDVSHISDVQIGDDVILMGIDRDAVVSAEEISEISDTINYEVVCRIGKRVPRTYI